MAFSRRTARTRSIARSLCDQLLVIKWYKNGIVIKDLLIQNRMKRHNKSRPAPIAHYGETHQRNYSKLRLLLTCIEMILPLTSRLINEVLRIPEFIDVPHWFFDKFVPVLLLQSLPSGSGALVWFSWSYEQTWIMPHLAIVMPCCPNTVLLPAIGRIAGDFYYTFQQDSVRLLNCCDRRPRTSSHQTFGLPQI